MKQLFRCMALSLVLVSATSAAQAPQQRPPAAGRGQSAPDMKVCQEAMARHDQMMNEMQTMDGRLQEQVKAMQAAQGQAKVDAIARVVSMMAEQRSQMHAQMMTMNEQMMVHMMSHAGQDAAAMQQCPMMQHMMKGGSAHQH